MLEIYCFPVRLILWEQLFHVSAQLHYGKEKCKNLFLFMVLVHDCFENY